MVTSLVGTSRQSLALLMQEQGEPAFRGGQIFRWIHQQRVAEFTTMTNLPEALRDRLAEKFTVARPQVSSRHQAEDGTCKWVLTLDDGLSIEAVYIPDGGRITLCLSSQVGCAYGCTFCATATMGKIRNLTTAEILGQVLALLDGHQLSPSQPFNIVFMGMGEPMDNLDAVMAAFDILTDPQGMNLSWRRITLSTVGHVDGIHRLAKLPQRPRLAVSLNATTDSQRDRLMPVNRKWPLEQLCAALSAFPVRPAERITCEYVLMAGETDTPADSRALARLLHGLPVKLNLIPWNPSPGLPHERPSDEAVEGFRNALLARGLEASIRFSRGRDAAAACGQLVTTREASPRRHQA